ncbi:hypothetical protein FA15DRAFT_556604, partial [Coprinopsis marcescibilis]
MEPLPASFRSLYRLLLRSCSASVLHHPTATKRLRLLYRPVFDAASGMMHKYRQNESSPEERARIANWLDTWNTRMDGTVDLLYNSSLSRGQAHQITRNLGHVVYSESKRQARLESTYPVWDATAAPTPAQTAKAYARLQKKKDEDSIVNQALGAWAEIIHLAEARDNLSLGRLILK